ncbi:uncharacterized protein BHQ10_009263 [Talaromyces amestolkiae]|uniref:Major facilitator superfamily (MFS) profile domain-containing protein n=1 Tax=Talaromyces amestolkiae TaxID=1196081 RepID=A0A364LC02_TALAM|nr:uncharacterized protein BHQ10_009263 [Talaromyces amestolkiae]RAO73251.1 hypothetical protein BHQ10_009263 [Talaromyces amestolkiae]
MAQDLELVGRWVPRNANVITILLIAVATVNSATMGYDSSMMNGLNILPQYKNYFHLNTATTGLLTGAMWMGGFIGGLLIQPVSDRLGRKRAILIAACINLVGAILTSTAHSTGQFVVGRICVGIGSELASGPAPALIAEILPAKQRGTILGLYFTCYFVGSLVSSGVNYRAVNIASTWAWRVPSIIQAVPSLLALSLLPLVPESPRWLIANNRGHEAKQVIAIIHGNNDVDAPMTKEVYKEIMNVLQAEKKNSPESPWKAFISTKANRKRLFIIVTFGVMVEMLGNYVISYYLGDMLTQAGVTDSKTQLQVNVILSCWSLVVAVIGSLLMDVVGRRTMTLTAIGGMIVTLYIFGGLTKVYASSENKSAVYGTVAVVFLFQGFYACGITPMTSLYPAEFLSYKLRNAGISIFRTLDASFGLMASFSMSYAMSTLGWKFYIINASWNIIFFAAVYFTWVETRLVPLEQVALKFGDLDVDTLDGQEVNSTFIAGEKM